MEKERKSGVRWCARGRLVSRLVSLTVAWSVAWLTMSSQESETSKSELEMAIEYSEYLAESGDEDDHVLEALWKSLEEARARRMSQGLFGSSGDGSQPASAVHQPSVAEPATAMAVQRQRTPGRQDRSFECKAQRRRASRFLCEKVCLPLKTVFASVLMPT